MKTITVFILIFLTFYFIWQFIKRTFFIKIFKTMNSFSQKSSDQEEESRNSQSTKRNPRFKKNINWDAETIDFEEISDSK